jgi:hypothetical protein
VNDANENLFPPVKGEEKLNKKKNAEIKRQKKVQQL